jgi:ATP-dependent Lon protease
MTSPQAETFDAPILTLRNAVLFPGIVVSFDVGRTKSVALAEHLAARASSSQPVNVAVFTQKDGAKDEPSADDLHPIGVLARLVGAARQKDGTWSVVLEGQSRIRLEALTRDEPFFEGRVSHVESIRVDDSELEALGMSLKDATREVLRFLPGLPREMAHRFEAIEDPGKLADFVAGYVEATADEKAGLLGTLDDKARLREVLRYVMRRLEAFRMRDKINNQVKDELGKTQREHVLRQQMKAIQDELDPEGDDEESAIDELEKRAADKQLSADAADVVKKQIRRLRSMQSQSPEFMMVRTYVEWILDVPWTERSEDSSEIAAVRKVLDDDHYGLEKVKKRILEYLAVRKLKADKKGPILCLIGPPGVGKTSLGRSVARATGRKFQRMSLGGVHDEAAIRGHRRTYVGALPGQVIQAMKKAATMNPVLMLDEVDKLGNDYRGDPSSALLEVLDPEQNDTFTDHYMEIPYDLSGVMFIATANQADTIPGPLRDRMEIIEIPGYTRREKLAIARRHLVPKQLSEHGLTPEQFDVSDGALEAVIDGFTREAGVRSLERQIAAVARAVVVGLAEGKYTQRSVTTAEDVVAILGQPRFYGEIAERTEDPGVATGLAWTPVGGEILFVEATRMPGKGKLILTGQLGDVMKESAQAAMSYARASADRYGIAPELFETNDVHVHVPAGGMPKDGPSAGVTLLTAIVSMYTGIRVRHDVAMTGEITLRGRVLPIGGVKEKVLAAHRAGIKRVLLPERNRADLEDVPAEVKSELEFIFVSRMDEVLAAALEQPPKPRTQSPAPAAPGFAVT